MDPTETPGSSKRKVCPDTLARPASNGVWPTGPQEYPCEGGPCELFKKWELGHHGTHSALFSRKRPHRRVGFGHSRLMWSRLKLGSAASLVSTAARCRCTP